MAAIDFFFFFLLFCCCCLSGQAMNITCSRVVYISIVIIFWLLLLSKTYWHVVQSINDLYCVCSAVVTVWQYKTIQILFINLWQCFVLSLPHFTTERMAAYEHHVQKGQRGDERPEINSKKKKKANKLDFLFVVVHYKQENKAQCLLQVENWVTVNQSNCYFGLIFKTALH